MAFAKTQFVLSTNHPFGQLPPNLRLADRQRLPIRRMQRTAHGGHQNILARRYIRCSTNNLQRLLCAYIYTGQRQPVRIRMPLAGQDMAYHHTLQSAGYRFPVFQTLDLQAKTGENFRKRFRRLGQIDKIAQPG